MTRASVKTNLTHIRSAGKKRGRFDLSRTGINPSLVESLLLLHVMTVCSFCKIQINLCCCYLMPVEGCIIICILDKFNKAGVGQLQIALKILCFIKIMTNQWVSCLINVHQCLMMDLSAELQLERWIEFVGKIYAALLEC